MTTKRPTGSAGVLAATGAVVLLIGCCALPALIAGGVLATVGGLLHNPCAIAIAIAIAIAVVVLAAARLRTNKCRNHSECCTPTDSADRADIKDHRA